MCITSTEASLKRFVCSCFHWRFHWHILPITWTACEFKTRHYNTSLSSTVLWVGVNSPALHSLLLVPLALKRYLIQHLKNKIFTFYWEIDFFSINLVRPSPNEKKKTCCKLKLRVIRSDNEFSTPETPFD